MIVDPTPSLGLKIEKYFFRTFRKTASTFYKKTKRRPASYPYITGDGFRSLADHIHDHLTTFDPATIKYGDIVFVGNPQMLDFLKTIHPQIPQPYILIQHNGDFMVDETIASYIDDKIICFFAQIVLVKHPKIIPIPIGIENKHHGQEGFAWLTPKVATSNKKARIFFHFSVQTNPAERGPALEYFKTHPLMDTITTFVPYRTYKKILGSYAFTVSPAGNTLGSHRTWEALYLRTVPIVKRTVDAEHCVSLGMPLWIVDDWHELGTYTEESLREKYQSMQETAVYDACYMDYWKKRIHDTQRHAREEVLAKQ